MDLHWEQLLCNDLNEMFATDVVVIKGGAKYFSPFIFRNPRYQKVRLTPGDAKISLGSGCPTQPWSE